MFRHDTLYYGGEILNIINNDLGTRPTMDRGGKYVWVVNGKILYCDMMENERKGSLEVHEGGRFIDQISYMGILVEKEGDCVLDEGLILSFLRRNF